MAVQPRAILANVQRLHAFMDQLGYAAVVVRSGKNFTYLAGFAYPGTLARHLSSLTRLEKCCSSGRAMGSP